MDWTHEIESSIRTYGFWFDEEADREDWAEMLQQLDEGWVRIDAFDVIA